MCVFIDWLSLRITDYNGGDIDGGLVLGADSEHNIEWCSSKSLNIEGSYSAKTFIRAWHGNFEISGNPTKFLQGHNLFGISDVRKLAVAWVKTVLSVACIHAPEVIKAVEEGRARISRMDIAGMFDCGTHNDAVRDWIRSASPALAKSRQKITTEENSFSIGKRSNYLRCICYNKWAEMRVHKPHLPMHLDQPLNTWAKNKLRVEFRLMRSLLMTNQITPDGHLKKKVEHLIELDNTLQHKSKTSIHYLKNWTSTDIERVFYHLTREKIMNNLPPEQIYRDVDLVSELPTSVHSTYLLWKNGHDVKNILPQRTFYRHKKIIHDHLGLNINSNKNAIDNKAKVIPLLRVLEAEPCIIPEWAYEQKIVACS
jgi:II/X family phage/plasmid replication protein